MTGITGLTNTAANNISNTYSNKTQEASNATQVIATGTRLITASVDPASLAISEKLRTNINVLNQANSNTMQGSSVVQMAVGAQQNILSLLTSMKGLTTQANNGSQDSSTLALINDEYQKLLSQIDNIASQARWNGVSLLEGGAGSVAVAAAQTMGITGTGTDPTGNITAFDLSNSQGYISGTFTGATVTGVGSSLFEVTVTMTNTSAPGSPVTETYTGTVGEPTASGLMNLTSTTDPGNVIVLDYGATVANWTGAAQFESSLQAFLNIGPGLTGASVAPTATAVNGGITANSSITASSNTPVGAYALTYDSTTQIMKLTNGAEYFEQSISASGAQTVTFANGVSVALDATFATGTSITQVVFNVDASTSAVSMNFQVAEKSTDILTIDVAGSTTSTLGLKATNVTSVANAASAGILLDAAIQTMNSSIAKLGAQQKQLQSASQNLTTSIENTTAALGVYYDADIPAEMGKLTTANVFTNLSQAMLTQAFELQRGLVQLAR